MSSFDEDMIDHEEVISQPSAQHPGQAFGGLAASLLKEEAV